MCGLSREVFSQWQWSIKTGFIVIRGLKLALNVRLVHSTDAT